MAAGLGFKTFSTGEVLTAADTNGYLMQGVLVFTNAAARDAAITTPQEGQTCYLKSTDAVMTYSGSTWVAVGGGSPLTTKGDLYTFSTVDARLAVGTNGQVLTADSSEATGLKFATPAASSANFTLLNSGGTALTGAATITVSFSAKKALYVLVTGASSTVAASSLFFRFNSDASNNYGYNLLDFENTGIGVQIFSATNFLAGGKTGSASANTSTTRLRIDATDQTTGVMPGSIINTPNTGGVTGRIQVGQFQYTPTAAITSVSVISDAGNFDAGTIFVYGG